MTDKRQTRNKSMTQPPATGNSQINLDDKELVRKLIECFCTNGGDKKLVGRMEGQYGNQAQDYVQQAYEEFLKKPEQVVEAIHKGCSFKSIVEKRAICRALNDYKKSLNFPFEKWRSEEESSSVKADPNEILEAHRIIKRIRAEESTDDEKNFQIFLNVCVFGMTQEETAKNVGKSEGYIRKRYQKALATLQATVIGFFSFLRITKASVLVKTIVIGIVAFGSSLALWEGVGRLILPTSKTNHGQKLNRENKAKKNSRIGVLLSPNSIRSKVQKRKGFASNGVRTSPNLQHGSRITVQKGNKIMQRSKTKISKNFSSAIKRKIIAPVVAGVIAVTSASIPKQAKANNVSITSVNLSNGNRVVHIRGNSLCSDSPNNTIVEFYYACKFGIIPFIWDAWGRRWENHVRVDQCQRKWEGGDDWAVVSIPHSILKAYGNFRVVVTNKNLNENSSPSRILGVPSFCAAVSAPLAPQQTKSFKTCLAMCSGACKSSCAARFPFNSKKRKDCRHRCNASCPGMCTARVKKACKAFVLTNTNAFKTWRAVRFLQKNGMLRSYGQCKNARRLIEQIVKQRTGDDRAVLTTRVMISCACIRVFR